MKQKTKEKKKLFKGERTASTIIIIIGLIGFLIAVAFDAVPVITLILAALSSMATYEVVRAVGNQSKILYILSCTFSAVSVFFAGLNLELEGSGVFISFYVIVLMSLTVIMNKKITFIHAATAFFASLVLPYAFSGFVRLNNIEDWFAGYTHQEGIYFVGLGFACSWLTDSFAYLVGRKFGKHKMAPVISPKKSVEGAIGGVVITAAFNVLILYLFTVGCKNLYDYSLFGDSAMKYLYIIPISVVLSLVSMMGDLAASVLKRNFGIKDYSQLLPGHGGIMDRFDSCVFVIPTLYGIIRLISL
ncbi:MAG: phosphatidate cytidylyltransferase [Clostridia bacterium]|nr:phosphatidate cytidylyltransferase [Clostridia bacterium]